MKNYIVGVALLIIGSLSAGCVVGRRTVALPVSHASIPTAASKGTFTLSGAEDGRHFENKPSHPSTPSIDGDVNSMSKDQLTTMIGRQRNGYGHAMGDVALTAPDTVKTKMLELIQEGLIRAGYSVSNGAGSDNNVSVRIDQFWAWFTPKFVVLTFEARVRCNVTVTRAGKSVNFDVEGYGSNQGQVASDANWQLAYTRAFDHFLENFQQELTRAGF